MLAILEYCHQGSQPNNKNNLVEVTTELMLNYTVVVASYFSLVGSQPNNTLQNKTCEM